MRAWFQRLKLKCDGPLSSFAFNFNLRRYTVGPANSVASLVGPNTVRVVVNLEPVGEELGIGYAGAGGSGAAGGGGGVGRDVFLRGGCDEGFLALARWGGAGWQYQNPC
jgi:hypothetical protein